MSSKIDWSKAPEGATHYDTRFDVFCNESGYWYQTGDWVPDDEQNEWGSKRYVERPAPWNGGGLPPVGTKCEVQTYNNTWAKCRVCTVVAHFEGRAVVVLDNSEDALIRDAEDLRPIRTPEQIAAEKREREINELVEVIVTHYEYPKGAESYIGLAKALHSAGYRKTEQEQDQ